MSEIDYDISWDHVEKQHKVLIDFGEDVVYLTYDQLREMLIALEQADESIQAE